MLNVSRLAFLLTVLVTGCAVAPPVSRVVPRGKQGSVHGGQQPVSGASVQLYAVGTTGDGSSATPLLSPAVMTVADGSFAFSGLFTCPSPSTLVYLVATGGSPGLSGGATNPNIAAMAALGPCNSLSDNSFIDVNEVTTVAAVYALAPFLSGPSGVGSTTSDAAALATAFNLAAEFANVATGLTPGTGIPAGTSIPTAQINTIADIIASCINSGGGVAGDSSACGALFSLTTPASTAPTNTVNALLNLADNPTLNTTALYRLVTPSAPFLPSQTAVPPDLAVRPIVQSNFSVSPSPLTFPSGTAGHFQNTQTLTITNGGGTPVNIGSVAVSGVASSDFNHSTVAQTDCVITVLPETTCTYEITFSPTAAGARDAYFILNNDSPNPVIAVPLSGQGSAPVVASGPVTVSPSSLSFTSTQTLNVPQNVTLTNAGSTALVLYSILVNSRPGGQGSYTQTNNCGTSLAPQTSCTITVVVPKQPAFSTATLIISDDASPGSQTVALSSSPTIQPQSAPSSIDFRGWSLGATGTFSLPFSFSSPANAAFAVTIGGTDSSDFGVTPASQSIPSCPVVQGYTTCTVTVTFHPSALGARSASLQIAGLGIIPITGAGQPAGINFGIFGVPVNAANGFSPAVSAVSYQSTPVGLSTAASVFFRNTGTVSPVSVATNPVLSGPGAANFTVTGTTCDPIVSGCSWSVNFAPLSPGLKSATVTFTDTGNNVQRTLTLSGQGLGTAPAFDVTKLTFTNTVLNTVSPDQPVSITGLANDPVYATVASPFVLTRGNFCASTPCQLYVAYAPKSDPGSGGDSGNLTVRDGLSGLGNQVQLLGLPAGHFSITPQSLTFAHQAVGTPSATQTVTLVNDGGTTQTLGVYVSSSTGSQYGSFAFSTNNADIAPGQTVYLPVTFSATAAGTVNTTVLLIPTSGNRPPDPSSPNAATLNLTGTSP